MTRTTAGEPIEMHDPSEAITVAKQQQPVVPPPCVRDVDASPPMLATTLAIMFNALQILGISIAVTVATIEIESIVASGPIFSVMGIAAAVIAWRHASSSRFVFGLSASAISVICFLAIFLQGWSPSDAARPISTLLIVYELLFLPVGFVGFYRLIATLTPVMNRPGSQFTLRSLFVAVIVASLAAAAARIAYHSSQHAGTAIAVAICVAVLAAIIAICIVIGLRSRPRSGYHDDACVIGYPNTKLDSPDFQNKGSEL